MIHEVTGPLALLGHPVGHSLSPTLHNAALHALGVRERYVACDVQPAYLGTAVQGLRALGFLGANVTIPHKEAVIQHLDGLSEAARTLGAVNTIVRSGVDLIGHNTDHLGFMAPLQGANLPTGASALVLGAGGSARAVVYALARDTRVDTIVIAARRTDQALLVSEQLGQGKSSVVEWAEAELSAQPAELVVNTTPLGMHPDVAKNPLPGVAFRPGQVVYDLVYNPARTALLRAAELGGATALGGLGMLIGQANEAFRLWTGVPMPLDAVRAAVPPEFQLR